MANSIQGTTPLGNRVVEYSVPAMGSIALNYSSMNYQINYVRDGRQHVKKVYSFTFTFVISGSTIAEFNQIRYRAERILSVRGGSLVVSDGATTHFSCSPANVSSHIVGRLTSPPTTGATQQVVLEDVGWGPTPQGFQVQGMWPTACIATWSVNVECAPEDAFIYNDVTITGIAAEVNYGIDQDHYTTRIVTGRLYVANWGRSSYSFDKNYLSQPDWTSIREFLLSGPQEGAVQGWMDPVRIPPNFIRLTQNFHIDATENRMNFTFIDREVYRLYPALLTHAEATMTMRVKGIAANQYIQHSLTGMVKAPRDVSKTDTFRGMWEIIQGAMPFLGKRIDVGGQLRASYVPEFSISNNLYRNELAFNIIAYSPMGVIDVFTELGIGGSIPTEVFLPQGAYGSANLGGTAYRLERNQYFRRAPRLIPGDKDDPRNETQELPDDLENARKRAKDGQLLWMDLRVKAASRKNIRVASVNAAEGVVEAFQTGKDTWKFMVSGAYSQITTGDEDKIDYYNALLESILDEPGMVVLSRITEPTQAKKGSFGTTSLSKDRFWFTVELYGELLNEVQAKYESASSLAEQLNSIFSTTTFDNLPEALRTLLRGG